MAATLLRSRHLGLIYIRSSSSGLCQPVRFAYTSHNSPPAMDYLSYLYTPQQMSGGASFGHSTRVGNWSEDYELQQHRIKVCAPVVDPLSGASCMFRGCGAVRGPVGRGLQRAHPRSSMISRCGVLSRFPQG